MMAKHNNEAKEAQDQAQTIEKVFIPQASKQTEVIEEETDAAVNRIVEILKSEIKVL